MKNRYEGMPPRSDSSAYMRELRKRNRDSAESNKRGNRARSRALWRLARLHEEEFDALVAEELAGEERSA